MPSFLANSSTFEFGSASYTATSVSVRGPTREIVNATGLNAPAAGKILLVDTGEITDSGRIEVELLGHVDPFSLVGTKGEAKFSSPLGSVSRYCIATDASVSARVGDLVRGSLTLTPTDYTEEA